MNPIRVITEVDGERGWTFEVEVEAGGGVHRFDVTLNWSDYDHWSRGQVAPSKVVEGVFAFLLEKEPVGSILSKFDCSVVRRYFPDVDRRLPDILHGDGERA